MSYILDSLKKSEQKRQEGSVPDLHTSHVRESPSRKYLWPYLLLLALFINALLLLWWFGPWAEETDPSGPLVVADPSPKVQAPVPVEKPARPVESLGTAEKSEVVESGVASVVETHVRPVGAVGRKESAPTLSPPEVREPVSRPVEAAQASADAEVQPVQVDAVPVRSVSKARIAPGPQRLYRPSELPAGIAAQLPPLKLNLHYYSRKPGTRMVRIDGTNLREGSELKPGLTVAEITPHGVVLHLSGYRVWVEKP